MTDQAGRSEEVEPDVGDDQVDEEWSAARRIEQQALWVDMQVRQAMERGDFDDLPGAGKPIAGLGGDPDPHWWTKKLIEREQITGLAPPAIALRTEHRELDDRLDRESSEAEVRRIVTDFNDRVVHARRQLQGGPPVITPTRDVEAEVQAWRRRLDERRATQRQQLRRMQDDEDPRPRRRRWWRKS